ncbi:MAG: hypothetical protein Q9169_007772 [Polycauliona sp. 2 TL-2023]
MVPLDLWVGYAYPYLCQFDFIDADGNRPLNTPSPPFYINDTQNASPRLWSQKTLIQLSQDNSTNSSASAEPPAGQGPDSASRPNSSGDGSGLSSGAIAGAVVGAMIGGALIAGIGTFFWLRRQERKRTTAEETKWLDPSDDGQQNSTPNTLENSHVPVQEKDAHFYGSRPEMGEGQITELDAARRQSELGSL